MEESSKSKEANKPFAQALFDARDILLPKGDGKTGQRRRVDRKAIMMLLATQGDPKDKETNGLIWTAEHLSTCLGIGRDQLRAHLDWLVSVGLVHRWYRMNKSSVLSVDRRALRHIVQRQSDDRDGYKNIIEQRLNNGTLDADTKFDEWDPDDLEDLYFTPSEMTKEVTSEAHSEALPEARAEALAEARAETQSEAESEAQPERRDEDQLPSQRDLGGSIRAPQPPPSPMRHEDGL